jgi:small conductance mechanosensitive channel
MLGIKTTSFIAILGAAGLAIGLALQGSLSNFAGGVLILMLKPFRVGDTIEAVGQTGVVTEIQVFTTLLINPANKRVIIPNGVLSNGTIVNLGVVPPA